MTKDVLLSIKGLQFNGTEKTDLATIQMAQYYLKNGKHYFIYEESVEGSDEILKNVIKFNSKEVEVSKRGIYQALLFFEEKKRNYSNYKTPYGTLVIGISTDKIDLKDKENEIYLKVEYDLEMNYQHLAQCCIEIKACPAEKGKQLFAHNQ